MKRYKVLFVYNPEAGNGLIRNNLDDIIDKFQRRKLQVVPFRTEKKEALLDIFAQMDPSEYKKVVIAGGDGTINTVVNSMLRSNVDLPIAVFPSGTANDFAYYFDLPVDLKGMIKIATEENYTYADVGSVNGKYFVNVAALGFLVDVSQKTDPNIKNTLGVISYYLRGIGELPNLKPIRVRITSAEYTSEDNIFFMLVMNGRSAGGFKKIAPYASINDGKLDVIIFKEMPVIELMPLLVNVLTGNLTDNKNVVTFESEHLLIESEQPIGTDIDGEKGTELPLDIRVVHNRIRVNTLTKNMEGSIW